MMCAGASASFGLNVEGALNFSGGKLTGSLILTRTMEIILPKSCTGGECEAPEEEDDPVFVDKGETCESNETETETEEVNSSYTVDGGDVTIAEAGDPEPYTAQFCVEGDTLRVRQVVDDGVTIEWTAERN